MKRKGWGILVHLLAWVLFLLIPLLFIPSRPPVPVSHSLPLPDATDKFLFMFLMPGILFISFYYLNYFVLIPRIYFEHKKLLYVLICLAYLMFILVVVWLLPSLIKHFPLRSFISPGSSLVAFMYVLVLLISFGIRLSDRWKETEQEKTYAELAYLKAQINPHFLFNTLNSLYVLAQKKSDSTAEGIIRLSDMMRYVTSGTRQDYVPLQTKIDYISNYISLQKLRASPATKITLETEGNTEHEKIAPMTLMPFIENAFKHGISTEKYSEIAVKIGIKDHVLELHVSNTIARKTSVELNETHLGIENTRKRLDLLYPGKHTLSIRNSGDRYDVLLTITLV